MDENNLPPQPGPPDGRRWLTLGLARAMLGINEATLRHWADQGLVRAFRTPGGHRRFSSEDIHALMETSANTAPEVHVAGDTKVLPRIRRHVRGSARKQPPAWMAAFDDAGHERMRTLGREFLELCTDFIDHPDRQEAIAAAERLGAIYGQELASRGMALTDALQAFIFFRNATMAAIKPALLKRNASAEGVYFAIEQLNRLTDEVLSGLTGHYGQAALGRPNAPPEHPKASQP
ncbi:MAG: helix-turn-helix domain-containing protein [Dehalococcoidia bacterium]